VFSQFFLLTLYMQQVLHYSAIQTGAAYLVATLAVVVLTFYVLAALAAAGAVLSGLLLESKPATVPAATAETETDEVALGVAA
jgi:hypothetical protein